jgi:hypothetical protein
VENYMANDIGVIKGSDEFIVVLKGKFYGPFPFRMSGKIIQILEGTRN